jgi:hypothetical protein
MLPFWQNQAKNESKPFIYSELSANLGVAAKKAAKAQ